MTPNEEWRPVVGFEGYYEVSNIGRVRSIDRIVETKVGRRRFKGRMKAFKLRPGKHFLVRLEMAGYKRTRLVHQLVIEAFTGPRPEGLEVCHNNGDRYDNRIENLRYDTKSANALDTIRHGANIWVSRTHCKHGHEFTAENITRRPDKPGMRVCLPCRRRAAREGYLRRLRERAAS